MHRLLLTVVFTWSLLTWNMELSAAENPTIQRIGIAGCVRQKEPLPALARYVESQPDLMLWIGDNVYADTKDDAAYIERCYHTLSAKPGFDALRRQAPWMATWDDHDYGLNDAGKEYPLKEQSRKIFRKFWQLEREIPENQAGIYYAKIFGAADQAVQVIMLDVRFNRDPIGSDGDVLGDAQWNWLAEQLKQPARWRLIVSGYQVLLNRECKSETWDKFPRERRRLFQVIKDSAAQGVLLLTGDQHYAEVCRLPGVLGYDAVEFQFCGLNQTEEAEKNIHRVSNVAQAKHKYALLDLQSSESKTDLPHVRFRVFDAQTNQPEIDYRVNGWELTRK